MATIAARPSSGTDRPSAAPRSGQAVGLGAGLAQGQRGLHAHIGERAIAVVIRADGERNRCSTIGPIGGGHRGARAAIGRSAPGGLGSGHREGVIGQGGGSAPRDGIGRDGHADLARCGRAGSKDLDEGGAGGDAQDADPWPGRRTRSAVTLSASPGPGSLDGTA